MMTLEAAPKRKKKQKSLYTLPACHDDSLIHPRTAVMEMQDEFRSIARQLCPRDKSTQDDLVQEMSLAVLLIREPQTRSSFRLVAGWRATDYLRWWRKERDAKTPEEKNEEAELTSPELEKCCAALNRLLGSGE